MLKHISKNEFEKEVLNSKGKVLVDFFATWCGPCQMLGKVLENVSNTRDDFEIIKVDVDENHELAIEYGVEVVPTMIIFKDGNKQKRIEGYISEEEIINEVTNC